jgi:hypothetical protein
MEKSEADLLSRTSSPHGNNGTSGPPILEDGSRCVGGRLHFQSVLTTGEEASAAGKSAGNTPYPNAAILFDSGDDDNNDIKCGRCENPVAYCHCSPAMLPPHINVDEEEEDDKEAVVPLAKTSNKENQPVEVRVGQGMGREADEGGRVQAHRHRMYTPGTPQHATRHSLSLPPTDEVSPSPSGSKFIWE